MRFLALALLLIALVPSELRAQPTPEQRVVAETLFQEGRRLMADERWAEACRKLEESYRIEPLAGVLLNLAVCHENEGRTATAWSEFKQSLALSKIDRRDDRRALAEKHLAALEPRLARLRIEVLRPPPQLTIFDGQTELPPAIWATARPVDPGRHTIVAEAPGRQNFSTTVEAEAAKTVTVTVPELVPVAPEPPLPAPPPPEPPRPAPPARRGPPPTHPWTPPPSAEPGFDWPLLGYGLLGVGAGAMAAGTGLGITALVREGQADARCGPSTCPDEESLALSDDARALATGANVTLAVGAVLAAAGVVTLLVAPAPEAEVRLGLGRVAFQASF